MNASYKSSVCGGCRREEEGYPTSWTLLYDVHKKLAFWEWGLLLHLGPDARTQSTALLLSSFSTWRQGVSLFEGRRLANCYQTLQYLLDSWPTFAGHTFSLWFWGVFWGSAGSIYLAEILFISGSLAIWGFTDSTCFISSRNSLVLWSGDGTFSGCLVLLRIFSYFYIQLFQRGFERVKRGQITHQVAIVMAVLTLSDLPPKGHP